MPQLSKTLHQTIEELAANDSVELFDLLRERFGEFETCGSDIMRIAISSGSLRFAKRLYDVYYDVYDDMRTDGYYRQAIQIKDLEKKKAMLGWMFERNVILPSNTTLIQECLYRKWL